MNFDKSYGYANTLTMVDFISSSVQSKDTQRFELIKRFTVMRFLAFIYTQRLNKVNKGLRVLSVSSSLVGKLRIFRKVSIILQSKKSMYVRIVWERNSMSCILRYVGRLAEFYLSDYGRQPQFDQNSILAHSKTKIINCYFICVPNSFHCQKVDVYKTWTGVHGPPYGPHGLQICVRRVLWLWNRSAYFYLR